MGNKMLRSSILLSLVLILEGVRSEYVWTGTEWKWNEPGAAQIPDTDTLGGGAHAGGSSIEGSGDDEYDDEDYDDDDYNYDDDDYTGKSNTFDVEKTNNRGYNPSNTGILPATDDEDMIDGSGDGGSFNVGSGGYNERARGPVTQPPKREPEVIKEEDDEYTYTDDYDDDDNYENYDDDDDDIGFDSDYDIHNIDVQVTAKPTPFAFPVPTVGSTTRRPTNMYTEAPEVHKERPNKRPSFFAQPGILAAVIGGAVVGLLCAILLVMFIVYRMGKKDEGSYALDEPKRSHNVNSYSKPPNREFYA